jgi:DNA polymerase-1
MRYEWDESDRGRTAGVQREAANSPIQGTGADILKRAARIFFDATKDKRKDVKFVNFVHDEINIEVPADMADEMSELLRTCMLQAEAEFIPDVELKVDSDIQDVWQKG